MAASDDCDELCEGRRAWGTTRTHAAPSAGARPTFEHPAANVLEGDVPLDGLGGGARDGRPAGDGPLDAVAVAVGGEVLVEDGAEVARLVSSE